MGDSYSHRQIRETERRGSCRYDQSQGQTTCRKAQRGSRRGSGGKLLRQRQEISRTCSRCSERRKPTAAPIERVLGTYICPISFRIEECEGYADHLCIADDSADREGASIMCTARGGFSIRADKAGEWYIVWQPTHKPLVQVQHVRLPCA